MGTSISQPSPRNTNWRPVHTSYQDKNITEGRIITEIWRASENESSPISKQLKDESIYNCYSAVKNSKTFQEATQKFNDSIIASKNNSMIAEFAKRAIPIAFESPDPSSSWGSHFFAEVTNYIISRDTSGFVGEKYRNKSVGDLIRFKKDVLKQVVNVVNNEHQPISSKKDWNSFIDKSINKLKSNL